MQYDDSQTRAGLSLDIARILAWQQRTDRQMAVTHYERLL
jgi:hypothetical protein